MAGPLTGGIDKSFFIGNPNGEFDKPPPSYNGTNQNWNQDLANSYGVPLSAIMGLADGVGNLVGGLLGGGGNSGGSNNTPPQQPTQENPSSPWGIPQSSTPDTTNNNTTINNQQDNRRLNLGGLMPANGSINFPSPAPPVPVPAGQPNQFIPAVYNGPAPGEAPNPGYIMTGGNRGGLVPPPPPYTPSMPPGAPSGGGGPVQDLGPFMQGFADALNGPGAALTPQGYGGGAPGGPPPYGMPPPGYGGGYAPPQQFAPPQMMPPPYGGPPVNMPQGGDNPFQDVAPPSYGQYAPSEMGRDALNGTPDRPGLQQRADQAWQQVEESPEDKLKREAEMYYPNNMKRPGFMQRALGALTATSGQGIAESIQPPSPEEMRRRFIQQQHASKEFQKSVQEYRMAREEAGRMERAYGTAALSFGRLLKGEEEMRWRQGKLTASEKTSLAKVAQTMPPGTAKDEWLKTWVAAGAFSKAEAQGLRGQVVSAAAEQDLNLANKYNSYLAGTANVRAKQLAAQMAQDVYGVNVYLKGLEAYQKYLQVQESAFKVQNQGQVLDANLQAKQARTRAAIDLVKDRQAQNFTRLGGLRNRMQGMMEMVGDLNHPAVDSGVKSELADSYKLITRSMLDADPRAQRAWNAINEKWPTPEAKAQNSGTIEATLQAAGLPFSLRDFIIGYEGYNPFFRGK